jgi:hypothetical protein
LELVLLGRCCWLAIGRSSEYYITGLAKHCPYVGAWPIRKNVWKSIYFGTRLPDVYLNNKNPNFGIFERPWRPWNFGIFHSLFGTFCLFYDPLVYICCGRLMYVSHFGTLYQKNLANLRRYVLWNHWPTLIPKSAVSTYIVLFHTSILEK